MNKFKLISIYFAIGFLFQCSTNQYTVELSLFDKRYKPCFEVTDLSDIYTIKNKCVGFIFTHPIDFYWVRDRWDSDGVYFSQFSKIDKSPNSNNLLLTDVMLKAYPKNKYRESDILDFLLSYPRIKNIKERKVQGKGVIFSKYINLDCDECKTISTLFESTNYYILLILASDKSLYKKNYEIFSKMEKTFVVF